MNDGAALRLGPPTRRDVAVDADVVRARYAASSVAADVGFDERTQSDVGLVATELATNVRTYADAGTLVVHPISAGDRRGVRLTSTDRGPGIQHGEAAFEVGASTSASLGHGLGTVNRLMDTVEVTAGDEAGQGTRVVADRWIRPRYPSSTPCPLSIGAATRAIRPGEVNGDTFVVKRWNDTALVGIVDGLGHGPAANEAAVRARDYVESHYDQPLAAIFHGTERACKGTRGVVMCLVRFDWHADTVTVANVGNVTARTSDPAKSAFPVVRGVVGGNAPAPVVVTEPWSPGTTMVLHSDGIATAWGWSAVHALPTRTGPAIANWLLDRHAAEADDATVVAVTERQEATDAQ